MNAKGFFVLSFYHTNNVIAGIISPFVNPEGTFSLFSEAGYLRLGYLSFVQILISKGKEKK
jgi:hypothetical protein